MATVSVEVLDQPLHVFPVDQKHMGRPGEGGAALAHRPENRTKTSPAVWLHFAASSVQVWAATRLGAMTSTRCTSPGRSTCVSLTT